MAQYWPYKIMKVASLRLDERNPRLTREGVYSTPKDIIRHLFDHEDTLKIAQSIATRGFFSNEPLLVVKEENTYVVLEGNRRLAAVKALLKPDLLEGASRRAVERLGSKASDRDLTSVPVIVAPARRPTDRLLAGRHIGTAVKAWDAENRAAFILEKLEEGYDAKDIERELGFSDADIRDARKTDAIAKLIKAAPLPVAVRERLDNPNAKVISTVERLVESSVGRKLIMLEPDSEHGVRGTTSKEEFLKGFVRLLSDIAAGRTSSRKLNTNEDMKAYFSSLGDDRPKKRGDGFIPADLVAPRSQEKLKAVSAKPTKKSKVPNKWVVPKSFKVLVGAERLVEIRNELTKLDRAKFPNAGAVLLRVFLELSMVDYLQRHELFDPLVEKIKKSGNQSALKHGVPIMRELRKEFTQIAKKYLPEGKSNSIEKALRRDAGAPFGVDDMHSFVHQLHEFPGDREISTFWNRMQPLFEIMLQNGTAEA